MKWNASSMRWEKRGLVGVYVFVLTGLLSIYLIGRVCDCIRWHFPPFDGERNCIKNNNHPYKPMLLQFSDKLKYIIKV